MNKILIICFTINTFTFFICGISFAGECTKEEIMQMVRAGYTKVEIDDICNKILKNPMCCCQYDLYTEDDLLGLGKMKYKSTSYHWMKADDCTSSSHFRSLRKIEYRRRCVSKSSCGR